MPWDPQTQDAINRALAHLAQNPGLPQPAAPQPPTPFQEQAASRATRLWKQAGPNWEMENDDRYRANMLGSPYHFPLFAGAEPVGKLLNARRISDAASQRRVAADTAPRGRKPKGA